MATVTRVACHEYMAAVIESHYDPQVVMEGLMDLCPTSLDLAMFTVRLAHNVGRFLRHSVSLSGNPSPMIAMMPMHVGPDGTLIPSNVDELIDRPEVMAARMATVSANDDDEMMASMASIVMRKGAPHQIDVVLSLLGMMHDLEHTTGIRPAFTTPTDAE